MARMRSSIFESFVFVWLVASGEAILPLPRDKETTPSKNNLADNLSGKSEPAKFPVDIGVSSTYECLYVSPDLPVCDIERMEDSEEDITHSGADYYRQTKASTENFGKSRRARITRNVLGGMRTGTQDSPGRHIIVYTIEGCLPPRLPFTMPSCQRKSSLDKILEVRKLYPFTVKGLTRPPLVFPKFNFDRWARMMKRLRSHGSTSITKNQDAILKDDPSDAKDNRQSRATRASSLADAAAIKVTMPNRTMTGGRLPKSSSLEKGSSPYKQNKLGKIGKSEQRKIKLANSWPSGGGKKLATKKKIDTEDFFTSMEAKTWNVNEPRTNSPKNNAERNLDARGIKADMPNSNGEFRILQKSWDAAKGGSQEFDRQRSDTSRYANKDVTSSVIPEIPTLNSYSKNLETVIGMKETANRRPINFDGLSNNLDSDPNLLRSVPSSEYNKFQNPRHTALDVNELLKSLTENSRRRRREARLPSEFSGQIFSSESSRTRETIRKLAPSRHRVPRETRHSKVNGLAAFDKSSSSLGSRGTSFELDKDEAVNRSRGSFDGEHSRKKALDTGEYSMAPSKSHLNKAKDTRNKSTILYKSKKSTGKRRVKKTFPGEESNIRESMLERRL